MKKNALFVGVLLSFTAVSYTQTFPVKVQSGQVSLFQPSSGIRSVVIDSGAVSIGDSVTLFADNQAVIYIENSSRLLLKGPCALYLDGATGVLVVTLDDGQIFLDRNEPHAYDSLALFSKGYTFVPLGTAAGLKTTRQGIPTTAVLRGTMRMQSIDGENILVTAGNFGTVDANGKMMQGKLAPRAISSLESWAGVKQETPASSAASQVAQESTPAVPQSSVPALAPSAEAPTTPPAPQLQSEAPAPVPQETQKDVTPAPAPQAAPAAKQKPAPVNQQPVAKSEQKKPAEKAKEEKPKEEKPKEEKQAGNEAAGASKSQWEIGAGVVTVDGSQWTRLNVGVDVPVWKFGVFFDLEAFIDDKGQFSNKGWDFRDNLAEALSRKIRYIRFGQEQDPLFIKVGGLSSVTFGYGFLVDRFTNMLHYPDEHLLGLQFNLNDISPIGITLQTLVADFFDFRNDGGVAAARLAFTPFKSTGIPIVNGISAGGTYAIDMNEFAQARAWDFSLTGPSSDRDNDTIIDGPWQEENFYAITGDSLTDAQRDHAVDIGIYDTLIENRDKWASREISQFSLIGGDVGVPIIRLPLLSLDIYGQAGVRGDFTHGWGIGAPGAAVKVWQLWGNLEYRRIEGRFTPGYFGPYYLDERLTRTPVIEARSERIPDDTLNGVFGRVGLNIVNALIIEGSYQYMVGKEKKNKDQRFEISGSVGDLVISKIPKLSKVEVYLYKTDIGSDISKYDENGVPVRDDSGNYTYDTFFEETPYMYYGYRAGFAITQGASLIFDSRYGFLRDGKGRLKPNNNIRVQTEITF